MGVKTFTTHNNMYIGGCDRLILIAVPAYTGPPTLSLFRTPARSKEIQRRSGCGLRKCSTCAENNSCLRKRSMGGGALVHYLGHFSYNGEVQATLHRQVALFGHLNSSAQSIQGTNLVATLATIPGTAKLARLLFDYSREQFPSRGLSDSYLSQPGGFPKRRKCAGLNSNVQIHVCEGNLCTANRLGLRENDAMISTCYYIYKLLLVDYVP